MKIKAKSKFNNRKIIASIDKNSVALLLDLAINTKEEIEKEISVDTGYMKANTKIDPIKTTDNKISTLVGTDDHIKYAKFAYYPSLTKNYKGNDWIAKAMQNMKPKIPQLINKYDK